MNESAATTSFGLSLSYSSGIDAPRTAVEAERRGIDRFVVAETARNPFLQLARAADTTQGIALGSGVAVAFARTPMAMAYDAWGVHEVSGGRAVLGLGSQVKAHIVRRFGMPWDKPAARMREYIHAVRAIWDCWQTGADLDFQGDFYSHTLMTPLFSPNPVDAELPPILLAGVGPLMTRTAGEVADGFIGHAFTTVEYLSEKVLPVLREARAGSEAAGAPWTARPFEVGGNVLTAVGHSDEEIRDNIGKIRERIAFYASTPAYRPVLDLHGWGALQEELHALSVQGRWTEMGTLIDDEVFAAFAVAGTPEEAAREIHRRYGGLLTTLSVNLPGGADPALTMDVLTAVRELGNP